MDKRFYPRLALDCIRKNRTFYIPYLFTVMGAAAGFYILCTTTDPAGLGARTGFSNVALIMRLCAVVLALVCAGFLLYTNGFLMKQRYREFGLYSVLGMNRVNLTKLLWWETVFTALFGLGGGIGLGVIFDRLLLLLLCRITDISLSGPIVYWRALILTAALFGVVLAVIFAANTAKVGLRRPADLIRATAAGSKEPKARWLLALIGVLCLGGGYGIAVTTPLRMQFLDRNIIFDFFKAVLLVIAGTYLLFLAGSVTGLKLLRRWKSYYYKPNHFISVSGLIYRMGRNAAGLASICILSTAVLVMVSSTTSLYAGIESDLDRRFPRQVMFSFSCDEDIDWDGLFNEALDEARAQGYHPENIKRFDYSWQHSREQMTQIRAITADGYTQLTGTTVALAPGQVLLSYDADHLEVGGTVYDYEVAGILPKNDAAVAYINRNYNEAYPDWHELAVVADDGMFVDVIPRPEEMDEDDMRIIWNQINHVLEFDLPAGEDMTACRETVQDIVHQFIMANANGYGMYGDDRASEGQMMRMEYGGLLFLGLYLGLLFLAGAGLIIYYKQVSEGHEDRQRFAIMEKVGLDRAMTARAIHSQILLVFFLPLVTAACHMAMAYPLIVRLLNMYGMNDTSSFLACTLISVAGFTALYTAVYLITARTYSKLIGQ